MLVIHFIRKKSNPPIGSRDEIGWFKGCLKFSPLFFQKQPVPVPQSTIGPGHLSVPTAIPGQLIWIVLIWSTKGGWKQGGFGPLEKLSLFRNYSNLPSNMCIYIYLYTYMYIYMYVYSHIFYIGTWIRLDRLQSGLLREIWAQNDDQHSFMNGLKFDIWHSMV